jgi:tRNA threonylcarbamoyladenosine biosynthesis protein TsaB
VENLAADDTWLLAWDLSGARGVLVLDGPGTTLYHEIAGTTRVSHLFVTAGDLLSSAGIAPQAIGLFGVGRGPGSFTGVRVAVTAAKVLADALHVPLVAPDSLMVLAAGTGADNEAVLAAIDARRGEVYHALYRIKQGYPTALIDTCVASPETAAASLEAWMKVEGCGAVGVGSGVDAYREAWPDGLVRAGEDHPRAEGLVDLCRLAHGRGETVDPMALLPFYLRRPDAREGCGDVKGGGIC